MILKFWLLFGKTTVARLLQTYTWNKYSQNISMCTIRCGNELLAPQMYVLQLATSLNNRYGNWNFLFNFPNKDILDDIKRPPWKRHPSFITAAAPPKKVSGLKINEKKDIEEEDAISVTLSWRLTVRHFETEIPDLCLLAGNKVVRRMPKGSDGAVKQ